ncbi:glycosyltransferase family 4 protein [uncultured Eubacterium sp.]|uniref:glycosyltransferase family 4 protein n=1 Tax=uncultured Eubacterium sp. TaxID=165185 RepID=UPI0025E1EEB4|nr:glycosyltransferase family 4 protein [uncultured Eubacterium sp.]
MRILLVNKFHYLRGGSEKYYFELAQLLKSKGHTVGFFSMKHEENITTGDAEYFVEEIDLNTGSKLKALDVIYSQENKRLMAKALEEFKPDIVHINNFQRQLSASIIDAIKEKNIPIVMTAHDLNPICPASIMLYNGEVCDDCITKGYSQCIKKKCVKGSTLKSTLGVMEKKYYDIHKVFRKIDCIISPSEFNKNQLVNGKLKYNEIVTLHNFVNESERNEYVLGDYAFYLGRLSKEKGILNLIEAIGDIPDAKLLIAGDGPERERIEAYISEHKLDGRITLLGYQNQDSIHKYITNSRFVVIPSICNENCPYSVLEAMEIGKPIVASRIGGIPELIADGENGYLYKADDINELKEKLMLMLDNDDKVNRFAQKSRELYESYYSPDSYYIELIKIYNKVMS